MSALQLPRLIVLTDRHQCGGLHLVDVVTSAVHGGARMVVFREKDLASRERDALADQCREVVEAAGGRLVMASGGGLLTDGVHLAARDRWPAAGRPPIVGRSCHDLFEVVAAEAEGSDYVTLSPIFATASKPGYGPALGLDALRAVVDDVNVPVYALGGIDASIVDAVMRAGASGVACMGEVMRAADPASVVSKLIERLGSRGGLPAGDSGRRSLPQPMRPHVATASVGTRQESQQ